MNSSPSSKCVRPSEQRTRLGGLVRKSLEAGKEKFIRNNKPEMTTLVRSRQFRNQDGIPWMSGRETVRQHFAGGQVEALNVRGLSLSLYRSGVEREKERKRERERERSSIDMYNNDVGKRFME